MSQTIYERWCIEKLSSYGFPVAEVSVCTSGYDVGAVTFSGEFTKCSLLKIAELVALKSELDPKGYVAEISKCLDLGITVKIVKRGKVPVVETSGFSISNLEPDLKNRFGKLLEALSWKCEVLHESISLGVMQMMNQLSSWSALRNERRFQLKKYEVVIRECVQDVLDVEAWDSERFLELVDGIFSKNLCVFVLEFTLYSRKTGEILVQEALSDCLNVPKINGNVRRYQGELRRLVRKSIKKLRNQEVMYA